MNYEAVWKVLSDMITEFRKRGETIKPEVMNDLRSAKTLIHVWKADQSHSECLPEIEVLLENVESSLILLAHEKFGIVFAEKWMNELKEAREKTTPEKVEATSETKSPFFHVPRGEKWIRVQISMDMPEKTIKELARNYGLKCKVQENSYILVFGGEENLKAFLEKFTERFRVSRKKAE